MKHSRGMMLSPSDWCGWLWLVLYIFSHYTLNTVMSDGNGGSGDGGGVRGDGGARDAGPQEPQTPGSQVDQTPALSPGLAVQREQRVAAGGGIVGTAGFWMGTWPLGLLP